MFWSDCCKAPAEKIPAGWFQRRLNRWHLRCTQCGRKCDWCMITSGADR
jgi:hypothetical protein